MTKTDDPRGRWSDLHLVHEAERWIDTTPLWDEDRNAYLIHAFAKSRAGINSVLHVAPMAPDGTHLTSESRGVFDGHDHHLTIEGLKFYERDGTYYVFEPAGSVSDGWQTVLRSGDVYGPRGLGRPRPGEHPPAVTCSCGSSPDTAPGEPTNRIIAPVRPLCGGILARIVPEKGTNGLP